jgi:hypothetical protein
MRVAAEVAKRKERRPELYCPEPRCLWETGGGHCPRHAKTFASIADLRRGAAASHGQDNYDGKDNA